MKISTLVQLVCLINIFFLHKQKNFAFKIIQVEEINSLDTPKNTEYGEIHFYKKCLYK
jgi:hypothetical protein